VNTRQDRFRDADRRVPIVPTFALTNLLLDVINPRFETEQQNQRDAITKMATELGDKILNLAEDIVQFGVDPSTVSLGVRFTALASGDGELSWVRGESL
jgi:hypothetical protein